ncbi:MAG: serine/threonine-protein kinase [Acidobacteriota bacterium]
MDSARWLRVEELFHDALDQPEAARRQWLAEACGEDSELHEEVASLLASGEDSERVEQAVRGGFELAAAIPQGDTVANIGPDRVIREVGRGGTGVVYLAEREGEVRQRVAVKVIKRGMDTDEILDRLRRERQILADLEHPNIARLIDGGSTADGRPYFAMELVTGETLEAYCDRHRLSIEQRLRLFVEVCSAVQYAHQKLVIHRDLKPSNILVTAEGMPKLLDFGIAKLLAPTEHTRTATGLQLLTPEYASPEQLRGQALTTATDVYSLGVVLYRLLTGRPPYRLSGQARGEMERLVCTAEATRPSNATTAPLAEEDSPEELASRRATRAPALARRLRGDLDNIVLMAMRKEPERRYPTVGQLAEDVERHLELRPVRARPSSFSYRMGKWARRYRAAVVAGGLAVTSLIGGLIATVHQARVAERHRQHAEEQTVRAETVSSFLIELFRLADPGEARGNEVRAREILDRGAAKIEQLAGQEAVQSQLLSTMGQVYKNLGLYRPSAALYEQAVDVRREIAAGSEDVEVARSLAEHADVLLELGELDRAEEQLEQALITQRRELGERHPDVATSLDVLGVVRFSRGDLEGSGQLFEQAVQMREELLGERDADTARSLNNLASVRFQSGALAEAETLFRRATEILRELEGDAHPDTIYYRSNLATVLFASGDLDAAEVLHQQLLADRRRLLGEDHPDLAYSLNNLADVARARGDFATAVADFELAAELLAGALGALHPRRGAVLLNLGDSLLAAGARERAELTFHEALAVFDDAYPDGHWRTGHALMRLGTLWSEGGDCRRALPFLERAVEVRRGSYAEGHWRVAEARSALGQCLAELERFREAELELRESLATLTAAPEAGAVAAATRQRLLALYQAWGRQPPTDL